MQWTTIFRKSWIGALCALAFWNHACQCDENANTCANDPALCTATPTPTGSSDQNPNIGVASGGGSDGGSTGDVGGGAGSNGGSGSNGGGSSAGSGSAGSGGSVNGGTGSTSSGDGSIINGSNLHGPDGSTGSGWWSTPTPSPTLTDGGTSTPTTSTPTTTPTSPATPAATSTPMSTPTPTPTLATCLGASTAEQPIDATTQCGNITDPTLAQGVLVDSAAPAAGADGSFAHPFATLDAAVTAVNAAFAGGSLKTKLYLVVREVPYTFTAPATALNIPFELYGGYVALGAAQYGRVLTTPSKIELPNGVITGNKSLRFDGVAVTTQRIAATGTSVVIVASQITSYPKNTDAELLQTTDATMSITDSTLTLLGSAAPRVVVLDATALAYASVTLAHATLTAGESSGGSYGARLYRAKASAVTLALAITDSTIVAGKGTGSVALLCGDKGDDLTLKLGKNFGMSGVRIERTTLRAGVATAPTQRSLALGLFNLASPAVIRSSVLVGGVWDPSAPLATALELRGANLSLVNNTIRDGDFMFVFQNPVNESIRLRNNIFASWEGGTGIFIDPNGPGAAKFQFADFSNNLFSTADSAIGYSVIFHPLTKFIDCKLASCPDAAAQLNSAPIFTMGGANLVRTAGFVSDTDFHLAAGSPAIDAGAPNTQFGSEAAIDPLLDRDGVSRTSYPDLGAYEFVKP